MSSNNTSSWEKVSGLSLGMASHALINRQSLRGQVTYVIHSRLSGRFFRISEAAYRFIGLINGERTVQEIYDILNNSDKASVLSHDETIELLSKLYMADVISTDAMPNIDQILDRKRRFQSTRNQARFKNPLAIKVSLFDPDSLLTALLPVGRIIFSPFGAFFWCVIITSALIAAAIHWDLLVNDTSDNILSLQNLALLGLCYPVIKIFHELGHGLATKVWGGEVHETGIIFLALIPVPYVNASYASAFPERTRRIIVGSAGIMVELFIASIALFVWLNAEHGLVKSLAYNTMLIGSVSTVLFNGNPLLRYDGYYVFSDIVGITNLSKRSVQYLGYLIQRYLFGMRQLHSPAEAPDERKWLFGYGILSYFYRIFILILIILFVAETYPFIGVIIAVWALISTILMPLIKSIRFILNGDAISNHRPRALTVLSGSIGLLVILLFFVPIPLVTVAEGIVSPPAFSELSAGADGVIKTLITESGSRVTKDQILIEMDDPYVDTRLKVLEARRQELEFRINIFRINNEQVKADLMLEELKLLDADITRQRQIKDALLIRSPVDGVFFIQQPKDMSGRFIQKGEGLGYVARMDYPKTSVAISQSDIELVRNQTIHAMVRLASDISKEIPAAINREVPAAVNRLPSAALGPLGGGPFAVNPDDPAGIEPAETVFEVEMVLTVPVSRLGERVFVKFEHGFEPLAFRLYRNIRQVFLRRFSV